MAVDKMPAQWRRALGRWERWKSRGRLKSEFEELTYIMLEKLREVNDPQELIKKYYLGNYWALRIARKMYPDREDLWDMGMTADVAYAMRYQELTGESIAEDEPEED